jgi:hypothetical protein
MTIVTKTLLIVLTLLANPGIAQTGESNNRLNRKNMFAGGNSYGFGTVTGNNLPVEGDTFMNTCIVVTPP